MSRIAIVGPGRLGSSLARALAAAGHAVEIIASKGAGQPAPNVEIVFLTVPDPTIGRAARTLARAPLDWTGKTVFHTGGLETSALLAPLAARGARVASFHPAQSFPRRGMPPGRFRGVTIAVEGDPGAIRTARGLVRSLGARTIVLDPGVKPLYHAACAMASNLLVPLFDLAVEALRTSGLSGRKARTILQPLTEGTLRSVKELDGGSALTGPIARLDDDAVRRHLEALAAIPGGEDVYRALGRRALDILKRQGVPAGALKRLKARLEGTGPLLRARRRKDP